MPLRVASGPASRNESSSESTVWNEPSYSVALKSITGIAGDRALLGDVADALLDAREELARHDAADDLVGELHAALGVGLDLQPDVAELAAAAGLLLVPALDLGLAADRLAVRDAVARSRRRRRTCA